MDHQGPSHTGTGDGKTAMTERDLPCHALEPEQVLATVDSSDGGLTTAQVKTRLGQYGFNRLAPPPVRGALARFAAQFNNALIYTLMAAGLVTLGLGHWVDSAVIFGVVLINALIGFVQEGRAERAIEAIRDMLSPMATVVRDGARVQIAAEGLVPGDIVVLQAGDKVPADIRLLRARGLQIQESALTGESVPVHKDLAPVANDAALGDRTSMAYSGTLVTYGQGTGVVVATGTATEIGQISSLLSKVEPLSTPLLRQLAVFGRRLTMAILALAVLTFLFGRFVYGFDTVSMFLAAVGLAVAAIPEGLPAIMTIALAIGVRRMAVHNTIIRLLPAVETLGSVTVICTDKTGTLTRNEMTVRSIATGRHVYDVTGEGYAPLGEFRLDSAEVEPADHPVLTELLSAGLLCSDAGIRRVDGAWIMDGDPTEGAIVAAAMKAGLDPDGLRRSCLRVDEIPFESERQFMATLHHDHAGHGQVFVKGAPEKLLALCDSQAGPDGTQPLDRDYWHRCVHAIARQGQRTLAIARRRTTREHLHLRDEDLSRDLEFLGVLGLIDPPRQEAIEAVAQCRAAGIDVKMITGDHAGTAQAVARLLGLDHADNVLDGTAIDGTDAAGLAAKIRDADVFARTSPAHKLRLVEALQADGLIVAMTGDGVNDAPALKRADIGVAMGGKGTDAAKEAAEMVLADDNFASIAYAVREGRAVYDNITKALAYILPTSFGEAFMIVMAVLAGQALPITAVQILWVNMITTVTLALAIAFERPERDVMLKPPRRPDTPLLTGFLTWRIVFVTAVMVGGAYGLFLWHMAQGTDLATARTIAVNTIVLFEVFYLFNARRLRSPALGRGAGRSIGPALIASVLVIVFQLAWTYAPPLQFLFDSRPLDATAWLQATAVAATIFVLVEAEKLLLLTRNNRG
jgi:magnesium-transporting ATPase (P-type)